jgi:hypothetical protein
VALHRALASCSGEIPEFDQGLGGSTVPDAEAANFGSYLGGGADAGFVTVFVCDTP